VVYVATISCNKQRVNICFGGLVSLGPHLLKPRDIF
jgi:hypothetical protein